MIVRETNVGTAWLSMVSDDKAKDFRSKFSVCGKNIPYIPDDKINWEWETFLMGAGDNGDWE